MQQNKISMDKSKLNAILDEMSTAILLFNGSLHVSYLNPAAEILLNHGEASILGMPAQKIFPVNQEIIKALRSSLDNAQALSEREKHLQILDGDPTTIDYHISPHMNGERPAGVMLEMRGIDRQLRITQEKHLLSQQGATRRLLRGLAHEIKNPLGGLRGAAQLLDRELNSEYLREYTQVIMREADRLCHLVDRMLSPNSRPHPVQVNIHEALDRVYQLIEAEMPRGIILKSDYDPSIPDISIDQDMLIQALLNIVQNALHAVADGGGILLRTRILRNYSIGEVHYRLVGSIEIHDNGVGIPEHLKDRIFFPMVSGKPDGTGLGLAIAQSLITQQGGVIECQSLPGHTIFTLLLPVGRSA